KGFVYGVDYIKGLDIIRTVDETETFNLAFCYKCRKIIVAGVGDNCNKMMIQNPNLEVAYFVDNDPLKIGAFYYGKAVRAFDALRDEVLGEFVVVATPGEHHALKAQLMNMGLGFGTDFYFYDERNTSYTMDAIENTLVYYLANRKGIPVSAAIIGANPSADLLFKEQYFNEVMIDFVVDCQNNTDEYALFLGKQVKPLAALESYRGICVVTDANMQIFSALSSYGFTPGVNCFVYKSIYAPDISLSTLLFQTITDDSKKYSCNITERVLSIGESGISLCCGALKLPYARNLTHLSLVAATMSPVIRIAWLSTVNQTFCFCRDDCFQSFAKESDILNYYNFPEAKEYYYTLSYDRSCNLVCRHCRNERFVLRHNKRTELLHQEVLNSLPLMRRAVSSSNGEVFFSRYWSDIFLSKNPHRERIDLFTNGLLFTFENWMKLKQMYSEISLSFSIDAVTEEVYRAVRGGDFQTLLKNIEFAADLREKKELAFLGMNFLIQKENFRQMKDFVVFARKYRADIIRFRKILNFGTYTPNEFIDIDVTDSRNEYNAQYMKIISDPIFSMDDISLR
ncbi:MAG: radical SAM protein, partial [Bacteroidales bacterium]|nr:radical SAM protein [Bacteroidales bacterium]